MDWEMKLIYLNDILRREQVYSHETIKINGNKYDIVTGGSSITVLVNGMGVFRWNNWGKYSTNVFSKQYRYFINDGVPMLMERDSLKALDLSDKDAYYQYSVLFDFEKYRKYINIDQDYGTFSLNSGTESYIEELYDYYKTI